MSGNNGTMEQWNNFISSKHEIRRHDKKWLSKRNLYMHDVITRIAGIRKDNVDECMILEADLTVHNTGQTFLLCHEGMLQQLLEKTHQNVENNTAAW